MIVAVVFRNAKPPERTRSEAGDGSAEAEDAAPPSTFALGRAIAIAKLGALDQMASNALLVLAGSAQRRRPVAALNDLDLADHGDEFEWAMRPYFRKTARKKRSKR